MIRSVPNHRARTLAGLALLAGAASAQDTLWSRYGNDRNERVGGSTAFVGDLDGDGIDDYAVGGIVGNPVPTPHVGAVRLYSGANHALLREITGIGDESFGSAIARAGDFDGDGVEDVAIGAPTDGNGTVTIVSGASGTLLQTLATSAPRARFGATVAGLGDVDGDTVPDYLVGLPGFSTALAAGVGRVEIVSGQSGTALLGWTGRSSTSQMGSAVANAGDWDQDGVDDAIVIERDGLGIVELVVKVCSSANGNQLMNQRITPPSDDILSFSTARAGDFDGDGRDEFLVAGPSNSLFGLWGTAVAFSPAVGGQLFALIDTAGGFGVACCGTGDVDGDGVDDFAVSRPNGSTGGIVEVYSGATRALLQSTSSITFALGAALDGRSDLDNDGVAELLVGGPSSDQGTSAGKVQVRSLVTGKVVREKSAVNQIDVFKGDACFGDDFDGDGFADLLIGNSSRLDTTERLLVLSGADGQELARFAKGSQDFGGTLLSLPDLDADLVRDFAVAAPTGASSVEIRSGATGALIRTFTDTRTNIGFGRAMAYGTPTAGTVELCIGAPLSDAARVDGGEFTVFNLATGAQVVKGLGNFTGEQFGAAIAYLGDINADGIGDWAVAAPFNGVNGANAGRVGFMSGKTGAQIRVVRGSAADDNLGTTVSAIDDVDGDGTNDLVVGVPGAGAGDEGQVVTVSGKNVAILATQTGAAAGARLGSSSSAVADANGDGKQDLLEGWASRRRIDLVSSVNGSLFEPITTELFPREIKVADAALAALAGPEAGPLFATLANDDSTGGPDAGAIAVHKLDDLYLQFNPPNAFANDTVFGKVRGGPGGALFALILEDVNGTPLSIVILQSTLDAVGAFTTSGDVPPGLSGNVYTLRAYAIGFSGKLVDSLPRTLTFE